MRDLVNALQREVAELGAQLRLAVADFKNHMESCDDRAARDQALQTERHQQNSGRLDHQDKILQGQNAMLRWLLGLGFTLVSAVIVGLVTFIFQHFKLG